MLPDFSCKKAFVTALLKRCEPQRGRGHTAKPYCLRGLVLSGHILDHRFLPHSYGDVGSLSIPLECGQALWLIFTGRFWQKWHCVTFQTDLKSSAIFEHCLFGSRHHVRSLSSPMETRFHLREIGSSLPATPARGWTCERAHFRCSSPWYPLMELHERP